MPLLSFSSSPKAKKKPTTTLRHLIDTDELSPLDATLITISQCTFTPTLNNDLLRRKLSHLLSLLTPSLLTHNHIISSLFSMLSSHLFHPLPPPSLPFCCESFDILEECTTVAPPEAIKPSIYHLHILYDILAFVIDHSFPPERLYQHVNGAFLGGLLTLFHTEDVRERERVKGAYHAIYVKVVEARPGMRKAMTDVLLGFVYEYCGATEMMMRHVGIGDLLEVLGSIVKGFAVPLRQEHRYMLCIIYG